MSREAVLYESHSPCQFDSPGLAPPEYTLFALYCKPYKGDPRVTGASYSDPRLAAIYDPLNADSTDRDFYVALAGD